MKQAPRLDTRNCPHASCWLSAGSLQAGAQAFDYRPIAARNVKIASCKTFEPRSGLNPHPADNTKPGAPPSLKHTPV